MGFTHQVISATKRQYTNENSESALKCSGCDKFVGSDEDCNCGMKPHFQKRSRDISPQRKPLGTMEMLPECQNIGKKTEILRISEHKKQDVLNLVALAEVVDAVLEEKSTHELEDGIHVDSLQSKSLFKVTGNFNADSFTSERSVLPTFHHITGGRVPNPHIPGPPTRITVRRGRSCNGSARSRSRFLVHPPARNQRKLNLDHQIKIASDLGDDESDYSGESDTSDNSEESTEEQNETCLEANQVDGKNMSDVELLDSDKEGSSDALTEKAETKKFPGIRPSQFSFVPPFINFCQHGGKCQCLPKEIKSMLKWRLSPITPTVVRETVSSSGFRLLKKTVEWTGQWGKHMKAVMFRAALKDYQKLNHLPATFQVGRKDKLWRNYQRHSCKFGKEVFGFLPKSYILPQEIRSFKAAWDSSAKGRPWIIKPPAGARGNGIRVINRWGQVPKKRSTIVQKYISKPFLINSRKFDIRLYVLVTSFHPLKIYIYREGLVRFAPVKYSQDSTRVSDRFMHLTNYSINKFCDLYTKNEDENSMEGHKWTLKSLWRYLKSEGHNVDNLWNKLEDIAIKTFICVEDQITASAFNLPSRYNGYELFGLDIILDERLRPWLLEVNISPSLHSSSPLDSAVKAPLIREVFNIVGYHFPDFLSNSLKTKIVEGACQKEHLETPVFDKRLYSNSLSVEEKAKQSLIKNNHDNREKCIRLALRNLTPDDVRYLIQAEDELSQCNGFKRIFPSPTCHEYFKFLEGPRYYNLLFDAWEYKYSSCRHVAIKKLQLLCSSKMHLQVAQTYSGKPISVANNSKAATDSSPQLGQNSTEDDNGNPISIGDRSITLGISSTPYQTLNHKDSPSYTQNIS